MEEAAGIIVYHDAPAGRRFLLLRNARHHTWGFPKGKLEPGESVEVGAARELSEETGITRFDLVRGFAAETVYRPARGGPEDDEPEKLPEKRVRYFLARVPDAGFARSPEHDAADWMVAEEVIAHLPFEDLKRIFRDALKKLSQPRK